MLPLRPFLLSAGFVPSNSNPFLYTLTTFSFAVDVKLSHQGTLISTRSAGAISNCVITLDGHVSDPLTVAIIAALLTDINEQLN